MTGILHPNLPALPKRIDCLPVDARGYPVPWFVAWIDGKPDFRVVDPSKIALAVNHRLCWVCGQRLGAYLAFTIGPMCAVNRISGEPPAHRECAIFSAQGCPFLTKPLVERREEGLPTGYIDKQGMIKRNPGVALVWITQRFKLKEQSSTRTVLFELGDPVEMLWFALGNVATREQILESMHSGLPLLMEACDKEPSRQLREEAREELMRQFHSALTLVPAE